MVRDIQNVIIPGNEDLTKLADKTTNQGIRPDKQRGTNCTGEMINYRNNKGENIRLYAKKSFLKIPIEEFERDYIELKRIFRNIIPNQGFISVGGNTFVFCAPISVKVDIFLEENIEYVVETIKKSPRLLRQLRFFIRKFEELLYEGRVLDLYGTENLVISDDDKLYYLDSFLVFNPSPMVKDRSIANFEKLKEIIKRSES